MRDFSRLNAIEHRLFNERARLRMEGTDMGRRIRKEWINQLEYELRRERNYLDIAGEGSVMLTNEELDAALAE